VAAQSSYILERAWSESGSAGRLDLLFRRRSETSGAAPMLRAAEVDPIKPWDEYVNSPAQEAFARRLVPELRQVLRQRLPAYMAPASIQVLKALPRTPNGKVDYRSLPSPEPLASRESFVAPRTEHEKALAEIWGEVLRLDRVGVCDDIFELGGDSLLIFQIASRAARFGFELTPRQLFAHRTIRELAEVLEKEETACAAADGSPLIAIPREAHRVSRGLL